MDAQPSVEWGLTDDIRIFGLFSCCFDQYSRYTEGWAAFDPQTPACVPLPGHFSKTIEFTRESTWTSQPFTMEGSEVREWSINKLSTSV